MVSHAKIFVKDSHYVKTLNLILKERRGVEGSHMFVFYHYLCAYNVKSGVGGGAGRQEEQ